MQVILQASRIRTKPRAPETIRLTPSASALKSGVVANAAPTPAAAASAAPIAVLAGAPVVPAAPAASQPASRALTSLDTTARPGFIETAPATAAGPLRAEPAAPVRRPADSAAASAEPSLAAAAAITRSVKVLPVVPKLINLVEPEIPLRLLARLAKAALFVVGFRINADGSVGQVAIQSGNFKALEPSVLNAVQQWRYQPLQQPHDHTVELVINPPE